MAKRPNLSVALRQSAGHAVAETETTEEHDTRAVQPRPPSRQGKKAVAGHFDPAVSRQLREIALIEDSSVQELLKEALNDLFVKRGKPPIA
jgi:hypothetical protein